MSLHFLLSIICAAVVLLLANSCSAPPPQRISKFAGVNMGEKRFPRHGEGELFSITASLPDGFESCQVEVTPFEHRVFRIRLEAAEIPGDQDALETATVMVRRILDLQLLPVDQNRRQLILPGIRVLLLRDFAAGPRAVALEITDLELEVQALKLKSSPDFANAVKIRNFADNIAILSRAAEEFILDNGTLPQQLTELFENTAKRPHWNGPYCRYPGDSFMKHLVYKPSDNKNYQIYAILDGKIIKEDSVL